jgi:hypothetical protein
MKKELFKIHLYNIFCNKSNQKIIKFHNHLMLNEGTGSFRQILGALPGTDWGQKASAAIGFIKATETSPKIF